MLGEELKELRLKSGLSQVKLAKRLGVRQQLVYLWESGQAKMAPHHWINFCEAVGVSPEELLTIIAKNDEKMGHVLRFVRRSFMYTARDDARQARPGPLPCPENLPQRVEVDPLYIIGRCIYKFTMFQKLYDFLKQSLVCTLLSISSGKAPA